MVVAALYFLLGAIKSLDQCSCDCGKWCIKGKQDKLMVIVQYVIGIPGVL